MKKRLLSALVGCLAFTGVATAEDITENKDWYVTGSAGAAVFAVQFDNATVTDIVANTYWGVGGDASLCRNTSQYFDICGGVTGFVSTGGVEQTLGAAYGGGTTSTKVQSYGAKVSARGKVGRINFVPFAGVRKITAQKTTTNAAIGYSEIDTTAIFGGLELATSVFNNRGQIGLSAEYGRSDGNLATEKFNYAAGRAFLRINF